MRQWLGSRTTERRTKVLAIMVTSLVVGKRKLYLAVEWIMREDNTGTIAIFYGRGEGL